MVQRKVTVVEGRAFDPATGQAIGFRPGETRRGPTETLAPTIGVGEQQFAALTTEQARDVRRQQTEFRRGVQRTQETARQTAIREDLAKRGFVADARDVFAKPEIRTAVIQEQERRRIAREKLTQEDILAAQRKLQARLPGETFKEFTKRLTEIALEDVPGEPAPGEEKITRALVTVSPFTLGSFALGVAQEKLVKVTEPLGEFGVPGRFVRGAIRSIPFATPAGPLLLGTSPDVQLALERPDIVIKAASEAIKDDPAGFTAELAGSIVGAGLTAKASGKVSKFIKQKSLKVETARTITLAEEVLPETTVTTAAGDKVKLIFDRSGDVKHFKVVSGSKVDVKTLFGLGKKKEFFPVTVGKAKVFATSIDDVFESQGRFVTRLDKTQLLTKVKQLSQTSDDVTVTAGGGVNVKGKLIDRLSKQQILDFLDKEKLLIPTEKLGKGGFEFASIGVKGASPSDDVTVLLSQSKIRELVKQGKSTPGFAEKSVTAIRRLPETADDVTGFVVAKPGEVVKQQPGTISFIGLGKAAEEVVREALVTPPPIALPIPAPPSITLTTPTREVTPSPFAGTGQFERTTEVGIGPLSIGVAPVTRQEQLSPFGTTIGIQPRTTVKVKDVVVQRSTPLVRALGLQTQAQRQAEDIISRVDTTAAVQQAQQQRQQQLLRQQQIQQQIQTQQQIQGLAQLGLAIPPPVTTTITPLIPALPITKPKKKKVEVEKLVKKGLAFDVFLKRAGRFERIAVGLPKGLALRRGARITKETLAATFKIRQRGKTKKKDIPFRPSEEVFREFKIVKGRRVTTPLEFVQRKGKRLGTFGEVAGIQRAKRRTPKKKRRGNPGADSFMK